MSDNRQYPSYDEWLAQKGLPSQPPIPATHQITSDYLQYGRLSEEDKKKHPKHESFVHAHERDDIYGYETDQGGPVYGPANWDQWYSDWDSIGKDFEKPFHINRESFVQQIQSLGYEFDGHIFLGRDNRSDHQIWRVVKTFPIWSRFRQQIRPKKIWFACKIASLSFYDYDCPLEESVEALLKEARILTQCRHPFVIRAYEYIPLEDSQTQFPFVFVATIMELMDGNLMEYMEQFEEGKLPLQHCKQWCRHIVLALDYLHNHIEGPGITRLRVAHMALCPVNVLYKTMGRYGFHFKLADFEECIIFDRNLETPDQQVVDLMPPNSKVPYWHQWSAPEVINAARDMSYDLTTLRVFPSDIYSLGSTLAYTVGGLNSGLEMRDRYIDFCVQNEFQMNSMFHFIKITTRLEPSERVSVQQLLTNEWLFGPQNIDLD